MRCRVHGAVGGGVVSSPPQKDCNCTSDEEAGCEWNRNGAGVPTRCFLARLWIWRRIVVARGCRGRIEFEAASPHMDAIMDTVSCAVGRACLLPGVRVY